MNAPHKVRVLQLTLHGTLVGHLVDSVGGSNALIFDEGFRHNLARPTFSLTTRPGFPGVDALLGEPWVRHQRLHPVLSNLLPEGALRDLLAQALKVPVNSAFPLFAHLGQDLPGALVATPLQPEQVPPHVLARYPQAEPIPAVEPAPDHHFSLAGVQMKFSMKEKDGRYQLAQSGELGNWIIKTPSTRHPFVPLNEYTAMRLAALAGVDIPEIALVPLTSLDGLPHIKLPDEKYAFAIRRFDRAQSQRIHMEDFAQVLVKFPHEKYGTANYEQIGKVLYRYTGDGLGNAQQFARRLLVNILLANGDAHLKNWSLLYADRLTPELSPAYDILTTSVYVPNESSFALNLGKTKHWYEVDFSHFETWARKADIPWRAIRPHLVDVMEKARERWPDGLADLPMEEGQKLRLVEHWGRLKRGISIGARGRV